MRIPTRYKQSLLVGMVVLGGAGLVGCTELGKRYLVTADDVLKFKSLLYNEFNRPNPQIKDAPDYDRGIWLRITNVHDEYTVTNARYEFYAETDTGVVIEDEGVLTDLPPGDTEEKYYDLSQEVTDNIIRGPWSKEEFELA